MNVVIVLIFCAICLLKLIQSQIQMKYYVLHWHGIYHLELIELLVDHFSYLFLHVVTLFIRDGLLPGCCVVSGDHPF